jgi:hypothetical protein
MGRIERLFGVSPDGGSGTIEVLLVVIPVIALYLRYKIGRRKERPRLYPQV